VSLVLLYVLDVYDEDPSLAAAINGDPLFSTKGVWIDLDPVAAHQVLLDRIAVLCR
jgi:hypothetical protein